MALRGTLLMLTGISWLTATTSVQSKTECTISWRCPPCSSAKIKCSPDILAFHAEIEVELKTGVTTTSRNMYNCHRTTCNSSSSVETKTNTTTTSKRCTNMYTQLVYPTTTTCPTTTINHQQECNSTTSQQLPTQCTQYSSTLAATHVGYITVILVLLAIIITLVVLMGYLVRRTTAQRGTVQTTEQPLTDMAAASDYCEPVALRQLQTSTEPEVYSEPADTLNRLHSATDRQGTPSCHVNPSYGGAPSCHVNPSYEGAPVTNGHSVLQQRPSSHPPLPDPPTDDSNTEYSKPVEIDNLPPLAENDYEVLEEVRREKEKTPGKVE